jgi:glycosyltransferase involved in cell wall biosynthesis
MLIRAHKALVDRGVLHRLVIVGDGPEREKLENLIIELGVEKSVVLTGYQCNPYPYIAASDMTVCSSVYEGLHIASIESLVLEKPVISCCDVVAETFGGYPCGIITENNQEALENGLEKMLTDSVLYKRSLAGAVHRGNELGRQKEIKQIQMLLE